MLIVAFGQPTMSRTQVQLQYNRFKESREDVNEDARPDRPSSSTTDENIEAVKKMVIIKTHIVRLMPSNFANVLGMKWAAAKIVSKLLNFDIENNHPKTEKSTSRFVKCECFVPYDL